MKIFVLISCYYPGFKAGGPIKTIMNMTDRLDDELEFLIMTRDRDLNAKEPYTNIKINQWNRVGKAWVFYASPDFFSLQGILSLLRKTSYDVLYLNSFFNPSGTIIPILLRWLGCIPQTPVIIAPRGEFSKGALKIKKIKKNIYLKFFLIFKIYKNCIWQASSSFEAVDIRRTIGKAAKRVYVAQDLLSAQMMNRSSVQREYGILRIIFISRISPMKNLDYLLSILNNVSLPLQLSIYGPLEDINYWNKCIHIIKQLPKHISAKYHGEIEPCNILNIFSLHDLFVFPTRGENFGHVIFEALNAGTAVIVSDQTLWQADAAGALEVLPLENIQLWIDAIERWANFTVDEFVSRRKAAYTYAQSYMDDSSILDDNYRLFKKSYKLVENAN